MARAGINLAATSRFGKLGQGLRQETKLQFPSQCEVAFQTFFLTSDLLVEPGVLDGDRYLRGQSGHRTLMVFGKKSAPRMFQVQHPDHLVFVDQRHRQFRARFRVEPDITQILIDVGYQHGFPVLNGIAHQALTQGNVVFELYVLLKTQRKPVL